MQSTTIDNYVYYPIKYVAHKGQDPFHRDRYYKTHRALIAGTGSGKTMAGVYEDLRWALKFPGSTGFIFEPTYRMVKRILIPKLEDFLGKPIETNPIIKQFHRGDLRIDFSNGTVVWLGSLEDPESAEGPSVDWIHVDEARLIRHIDVAIDVIIRRLRNSQIGSEQGYPTGSWWTTTPDHPGSDLFNFFENVEFRNVDSGVYRMSIYDNIENLPASYIRDVERRHSGGLADRFIYGRFAHVAAGSLAFDFSIHVIHEEELDDGMTWFINESGQPIIPVAALRATTYVHDFGWTNPAAQIAIKWDGDGRAYALDEFYKTQADEEDLGDNAIDFEEIYGEGVWYCDPSEPRTIKKLKKYVKRARGYDRKKYGSREDGIRELGSRLNMSGDNLCRLYIHRRCVNLISEIQIYDADKKENDHAVDALRYGVTSNTPRPGGPKISFGKRPY